MFIRNNNKFFFLIFIILDSFREFYLKNNHLSIVDLLNTYERKM